MSATGVSRASGDALAGAAATARPAASNAAPPTPAVSTDLIDTAATGMRKPHERDTDCPLQANVYARTMACRSYEYKDIEQIVGGVTKNSPRRVKNADRAGAPGEESTRPIWTGYGGKGIRTQPGGSFDQKKPRALSL
jgi:hypothetical protein